MLLAARFFKFVSFGYNKLVLPTVTALVRKTGDLKRYVPYQHRLSGTNSDKLVSRANSNGL